MQDSDRALHLVPRNKGKEPIILNEVDALIDDELSLGTSPPLDPSPSKNTIAKLRKRTSHRLPSAMLLVACPTSKERNRQGAEPARSSP